MSLLGCACFLVPDEQPVAHQLEQADRGEPKQRSRKHADQYRLLSARRPAYMIIAPSPLNPLVIKGAGEGGITGAGAAVAAAIDDALGRPGAVTRLPVTPVRMHALLTRGQGLPASL